MAKKLPANVTKAQALRAAKAIWAAKKDWHDPKELSAHWHVHPGVKGTAEERAAWFEKNGKGRCVIVSALVNVRGSGPTWATALEDFKKKN